MKRRVWWIVGLVAIAMGAAYVALPFVFPAILARLHPEHVFRLSSERRVLYLTIDDAPSSATPEILAVLARHNVTATFFVIGSRVESPVQLAQIVNSGCSVGHHMWTYRACSKLSLEQFKRDFDATENMLRPYGALYFRAPTDFGTIEQMAYVRARGFEPILGSVFPFDPWIQRPLILAAMVKWLSVSGGIFIMHDGNARGRVTAQVLDRIIPELKRQGYELRSLPAPRI